MANKLYVYGQIGYEVSADYMRLALDEATDGDLELRINSGGGDVFEGQAIYSLLESWKTTTGGRVIVYVDGIAASVASVIAMAGSEIHMSSNALMMRLSVVLTTCVTLPTYSTKYARRSSQFTKPDQASTAMRSG